MYFQTSKEERIDIATELLPHRESESKVFGGKMSLKGL